MPQVESQNGFGHGCLLPRSKRAVGDGQFYEKRGRLGGLGQCDRGKEWCDTEKGQESGESPRTLSR